MVYFKGNDNRIYAYVYNANKSNKVWISPYHSDMAAKAILYPDKLEHSSVNAFMDANNPVNVSVITTTMEHPFVDVNGCAWYFENAEDDKKVYFECYPNQLPMFSSKSRYDQAVINVNPTKTKRTVDIATEIIYGDREQTYGHPSVNLDRISKIWSVIFGHEVTIEQVAWCMVGLKMAREVNKKSDDNIVDALGYLMLIDRCREKDVREQDR